MPLSYGRHFMLCIERRQLGAVCASVCYFRRSTQRECGKRYRTFFGAMEIDGFEDVEVFKKRIDHWIEVFRKTKPIPGHDAVLIPGDPEHDAEKLRTKEGIPVIQAVVDDLKGIAKETGIPFKVDE